MSIPLDVILNDIVACMGFYDFVQRFHAEENLRFYFAVEVFANRSWKAIKLLGIDPSSASGSSKSSASKAASTTSSSTGRGNGSGVQRVRRSITATAAKAVGLSSSSSTTATASSLPPHNPPASSSTRKGSLFARHDNQKRKSDENAIAYQKKLDALAAKQLGVSMEQILLMKEADYIFDTFIRSGAPMWVCLDHRETERIQHELIFNYKNVDRNLFKNAQQMIYDSMSEDLLPRFLRDVHGDTSKKNGKQMTDDEIYIKEHISKLSSSRRRKTGMATAIAFTFGKSTASSTATSSSSSTTSQKLSANDEERIKNLNEKKSSLLLLQGDDPVRALPLSRDRLSQRSLMLMKPGEDLTMANMIMSSNNTKSNRSSLANNTSPEAISGNPSRNSNRISISKAQTSSSSSSTNSSPRLLINVATTNIDENRLQNQIRQDKAISLPLKVGTSLDTNSKLRSSIPPLIRQRSLSDPTHAKSHGEHKDILSLINLANRTSLEKSTDHVISTHQRNQSETSHSLFPLFSAISIGSSNAKSN